MICPICNQELIQLNTGGHTVCKTNSFEDTEYSISHFQIFREQNTIEISVLLIIPPFSIKIKTKEKLISMYRVDNHGRIELIKEFIDKDFDLKDIIKRVNSWVAII